MPCGSAAYWAITLSLVPLTAVVSLASALILVRNYNYKTRGGHDLPVGEVRLHPLTCMSVKADVSLKQRRSRVGEAPPGS